MKNVDSDNDRKMMEVVVRIKSGERYRERGGGESGDERRRCDGGGNGGVDVAGF